MRIRPQLLSLPEGDDIPNNPELPVLVYKRVVPAAEENKARVFREHFRKNGWTGLWSGGIFAYHHFHPDAHEALGIAKGTASVQLGGEKGEILDLEAGDLLVLPAGTGHKCITHDGGLEVIGAYPVGQQDYTLCRDKTDCERAADKIAAVPLPQTDPFYGVSGPLLSCWHVE